MSISTWRNSSVKSERDEIQRIKGIYEKRAYDTDNNYSDLSPIYLQRVQSIERTTIRALRKAGLHACLNKMKILDYGCGNGRWFGRWLAWGASSKNLMGVDIRSEAISLAGKAFPGCRFVTISPHHLPFKDEVFQIVIVNIVFSSILSNNYRVFAANEIARVLRPNGIVLWCDFVFDNPNNKNVRAVHKAEIMSLFPEFKMLFNKRIVLAPPIAKRIVPLSWWAGFTLEALFPFLRTHILVSLKK